MSCSLFTSFEIVLARFADPWFMLLPEILRPTHPDLYILVTCRASNLAFVDGQVWVCALRGFLWVTGTCSLRVQGSFVADNNVHSD